MSSIVECLLALRDNVSAGLGENMSNYPAKTPARPVAPVSTPGRRSPGEDRRRGLWDAKSPQRSPLLSGVPVFSILLHEVPYLRTIKHCNYFLFESSNKNTQYLAA